MKLLRSAVLLSCFFLSLGSALYAHVALDYPQGGETFYGGEIITIEWTNVIPHDTENWDLYFSDNGGTSWSPLVLDIPLGQLNYIWQVPYTATTQGKIRVVQDNTGMDYTDTSADFTIIVLPPDGPVFEIPAQDLVLECAMDNQTAIQQWLDAHGGAAAISSCGVLVWTQDFTALSDSCGATGSALVTFTVSDDCGINSTSARVTVIDDTPPVVMMPALDAVVICDGSGNTIALNNWLTDHAGAIATDACSDVTWTNNFSSLTSHCGATGNALVTFMVSDACGNTNSTGANFIIYDSAPPSLITPAKDTVVECNGGDPAQAMQHWLEVHAGATASDACSNVSWDHAVSGFAFNCGASGSMEVVFTASDDCGNTSMTDASFTIVDTTPPSIVTTAQDATIDCDGSDPTPFVQSWLEMHAGATAMDLCGNVAWTHDLTVIPDHCDVLYSKTVYFTVTDECGNTSVTEALLTLMGSTGVSTLAGTDLQLRIYPNPADEKITMDFDKAQSLVVTISLCDLMGRQLWYHRGNEMTLSHSVHDFVSGVYFLKIRTAQNAITRSIVIR